MATSKHQENIKFMKQKNAKFTLLKNLIVQHKKDELKRLSDLGMFRPKEKSSAFLEITDLCATKDIDELTDVMSEIGCENPYEFLIDLFLKSK